jgi:CBS domain-containing protein
MAPKLAGIFTERDALTRVIAASLDPKATPLAKVMTANVLTVGPEATVQQVMDIFAEKRCRHLPVIQGGRADRADFDWRRVALGGQRAPRRGGISAVLHRGRTQHVARARNCFSPAGRQGDRSAA